MSGVEGKLDEGEVIWDMGKRVAWRDKLGHGGRGETGRVIRS